MLTKYIPVAIHVWLSLQDLLIAFVHTSLSIITISPVFEQLQQQYQIAKAHFRELVSICYDMFMLCSCLLIHWRENWDKSLFSFHELPAHPICAKSPSWSAFFSPWFRNQHHQTSPKSSQFELLSLRWSQNFGQKEHWGEIARAGLQYKTATHRNACYKATHAFEWGSVKFGQPQQNAQTTL